MELKKTTTFEKIETIIMHLNNDKSKKKTESLLLINELDCLCSVDMLYSESTDGSFWQFLILLAFNSYQDVHCQIRRNMPCCFCNLSGNNILIRFTINFQIITASI